MYWLSVLSILTVVSFGLAIPAVSLWDDMRVKHAWATAPEKWDCLGHPPAGTTIDLRIALKSHHENALVNALYEVSDPKHPNYGAHLSKEEVAKLVAPHPDTLELVTSWLIHHGVPSTSVSITHGGNWLTIPAVPLDQANTLLGASYQLYRHVETSETVLRTIGYALPNALFGHVQTVAPTTYFGSPRALRQTSNLRTGGPTLPQGDRELQIELTNANSPSVLEQCSKIITPSCLRAMYNTSTYEPSATAQNQLGIAGYLGQFASQRDLTQFMALFRGDVVTTFKVQQVNGGGNDQSNPGAEANLDIQYAESISFPTPNIYYSTGGSPPFIPDSTTPTDTNEPYLDWLNFTLGQETIPQTISTSYGDDEQTVPPDYARSVCDLFGQLGARGVSALFSSGDGGVGNGTCLTNDGTNRVQFIPVFPASCPFVTAVGGTTGVNPEVAASLSGGGFSTYFGQPSYQKNAVSSYLSRIGEQYAGLYNRGGRAYPDISAQALNYQIVFNGQVVGVEGTSCSAPTVAGIISLLNDFRISNGKPSLGFLNPLLYTRASGGFNEIKSGSNPGCGTQGFTAMAGWNPVTGLGTPDFLKLKALIG
ncbi:peptidase S8/S53 domain-containing protein [Lactifluus volemus]|nr:peptidase S8/S53 domain-containing protein [Lactifluus volemus]